MDRKVPTKPELHRVNPITLGVMLDYLAIICTKEKEEKKRSIWSPDKRISSSLSRLSTRISVPYIQTRITHKWNCGCPSRRDERASSSLARASAAVMMKLDFAVGWTILKIYIFVVGRWKRRSVGIMMTGYGRLKTRQEKKGKRKEKQKER